MNQVNFLQSLGWSLINSLWQMALLWSAYKLIAISFNASLRPKHKASLAVIFTIGGFSWFLYTFITSLFYSVDPVVGLYYTGLISDAGWNYFAGKILPFASIAYLAILAIPVWQFIRNYRFVQIIRTTSLKKIDVAWRLYVKRTSTAMGITKKVNIWLSDIVTSPVTIGFLKPIILIPVAAMNNLTPHQLEAVILHELSHIYRYDYFLNLMVSFIKTVLYFNPFVKLLVKDIEREREFSCDEIVLQFQYRPGEYASALLRLEQNKHRQMVMAAAGKNHDLLHRIESILGMKNKGWNPARQISYALMTVVGVIMLHFFISVNKHDSHANLYTLSNESSPYYFLNGKKPATDNLLAKASLPSRVKKNSPVNPKDLAFYFETPNEVPPPANDAFMQVGFAETVQPVLSEEEESKVKEAVNATKKILQEDQWKAMEKSYADALTSYEKDKLKSEYSDEVNKNVNWEKVENQLRLSYDHINWENLNAKINTSLTEIKLDSIQHQINISLKNLVTLEKVLKANEVTSIPDTEISLLAVQENQQKAREQLAKLKAARSKPVIKL
jgi:bla regulator protein BlaR1